MLLINHLLPIVQLVWVSTDSSTYFYDPDVLIIENNPRKTKEILRKLNNTSPNDQKSLTYNKPKENNTKYLYHKPNEQDDKNFIEKPTGDNTTTYVTKFYKNLNENLLTS